MRLLLLDDTPATLSDLHQAAIAAGFDKDREVIDLANIDAARELYKKEEIQVAVIDLHLGDGFEEAGIEFIAELHAAQPECRIIGFSVRYDNQAGVRALVNGASDYVSGRWKTIPWYALMVQRLSLSRELLKQREMEGAHKP